MNPPGAGAPTSEKAPLVESIVPTNPPGSQESAVPSCVSVTSSVLPAPRTVQEPERLMVASAEPPHATLTSQPTMERTTIIALRRRSQCRLRTCPLLPPLHLGYAREGRAVNANFVG